MRLFMTAFCLSISLPLLAIPGQAHGPAKKAAVNATLPEAARAAAAVVDAFHRSLREGELDAAAALLANDALIYESGGVERSKAEYAAHHLPADAAFSRATVRTVTAQSGNADAAMAWIATQSRTTGSYKGRTIDSGSTETMILRRQAGTWKIVHIHWSSGK